MPKWVQMTVEMTVAIGPIRRHRKYVGVFERKRRRQTTMEEVG